MSVIVEKCNECVTPFHEQDYMKLHIDNKHRKDLKCQQCEDKFTDYTNLEYHILKDHEQDDIGKESILKSFRYDCEICEDAFPSVDNVNIHKEEKHKTNNRLEQTFFNPSLRISIGGEVGEV